MSNTYADFSDLEREFELEMESPGRDDLEVQFERALSDSASEDSELQDDLELALESGDFEMAYEQDDLERELQTAFEDNRSDEFVDRFLEIGSRQFESPYEAEGAMSEVLDDIEREYLFGAIKRGLKKLSKNKLLKSLAKKGMTLGVNKFFPGLQGALQLARGNVKGALMNFGKQALGSVVPGGGAMLDAVKSIGLDAAGGGERETWENYVDLSREAYEHLAENLTPTADQPAEAMRLANNAVQHAIVKAKTRTAGSGGRGGSHGRDRIVRLRVAPGERVKLILVGA
jgi:hypothetical protein